jgi:hypothetical protein
MSPHFTHKFCYRPNNIHRPAKGATLKQLLGASISGPAKYLPGIDIQRLEMEVWEKGAPVCTGRPWKVAEFTKDIGVSKGKPSRWVRVEETAGAIHGHPITEQEYRELVGR